MQDAWFDPCVLLVAPHKLLNAGPAHALHKATLHLGNTKFTGSKSYCKFFLKTMAEMQLNWTVPVLYIAVSVEAEQHKYSHDRCFVNTLSSGPRFWK